MQLIQHAFQYFIDLGMFVTFPIIIFTLGTLAGMRFRKAFQAAVLTGIGFVGIFLVINLLVTTLGGVIKTLVDNLGLKLNVIDIGWPVAAMIALSNAGIVLWVYLAGVLLNIALLALAVTKTLDVDLFNYWHFMLAAALVAQVTQRIWLGVAVALLLLVISLLLADRTAPVVSEFFGLQGVSFPHASTVVWAPLGLWIDKLLDRIPGLNRWNATPQALRERFGLVGEPTFIGIAIGFLLSLLAYFPRLAGDAGGAVKDILAATVNLAAVIVILPRMSGILVEGLQPFSEGVRDFLSRKLPGRELYIGIDAAAAIGHEAVLVTGMLLVPITLVLALLMNAAGLNRMVPYADLVALPFFSIWAVGWNRGNMVRALITGTLFSALILFIATDLAPLTTQIAMAIKPEVVPAGLQVSTLSIGGELLAWLLSLPFRLYGPGWGMALAVLVATVIIVAVRPSAWRRSTS